MFNEDKAFRLIIDGEIVGAVRFMVARRIDNVRMPSYLIIFLAKQLRSDLDTCSAVIQAVAYQARFLRRVNNNKVRIVHNLAYDTERDFYGVAMPAGNSSVVPPEGWF